ncbi:hypothetical protein SAMN06296241_1258 [Salinimicrobium sediminis]|uniref:PAP2 superfamily protein n=1 Tax=Salinimicrobium sediminis TaxID=1343891 RepID=A0A285X334_9FLAO|nr:hypothetical protein [Salinimicrobium sediminis]MDX1752848.1 hypothetical protein [Salinimicrobium sediminis]SOC79725.1 hypothetical protein SAMN06296241_1258 [Salinimicrobium sediminis]
MKVLLKSASYLFHPLWMPFAGTLIYFLVSPRFFPEEVVKAKILAISIMTIFIPVVYFFMLKTLGKVTDHYMREIRERKWPLLFYAGLDFVVLKYVLNVFDYPELYYFFFGIMISVLLNLLLLFLKLKASLHMTGLGGLMLFLIFLSIHFNLNLIYTISFLVAITGLTASSRLYYEAHNLNELAIGLLVGFIPQVALAFYWL